MQSFADIILGKADGKAATIEDGRGEPAPCGRRDPLRRNGRMGDLIIKKGEKVNDH